MELSTRLKTIVSLVGKCGTIADIGTDHAYIPIYLLKNNICKKAIASDINKGPVTRAKENIIREGLQDKIQCRLGGGLSTVKPKEIDVAVIAGMGGYMIKDILEDDKEVFKYLDYVVLQPVQNVDVLRKYIYEIGYRVISEELCKEDNKFYEIIKIRYDNNPRQLQEIYYEVSSYLLEHKHFLIKEYIEKKINHYNRIYEYIKDNTISAINRKVEVGKKILILKELLKCL